MKETNDKRNAFTSSGSKDEGGAGTVETTNGTTTDKVDAKPKIDEGVVATAVTGSTAVTTEETSVISNPTFQSRLQSLEARLGDEDSQQIMVCK